MPLNTQTVTVNIGPQHPSTHGVFRAKVTLDGERVVDLEPVVGYLHRGIEKLAEERTYIQSIPLTDRLDYISSMSNNWAYVRSVERLLGVEAPERAEYIRVIMAELTRVQSHFTSIGFLLNDLGAFFTPLMYVFEAREKILDLFEMASGSRMTCNYIRPGGVREDLPAGFLAKAEEIVRSMPGALDEVEDLLTQNEILVARCKNVGVVSPALVKSYGITGPVARASGINYDVRRAEPYSVYDRFDFQVPVTFNGDTYDRYLLRIREIRQSVRILQQAFHDIPEGEYTAKMPKSLRPPAGEAYTRIEGPRGELGFYLVSDGGPNPYRWHVRPPTFINISCLRDIAVGWKLADVVVVFGSIDIILGEVDR
jgi:NADH-quinone oxidoreductase subunit D